MKEIHDEITRAMSTALKDVPWIVWTTLDYNLEPTGARDPRPYPDFQSSFRNLFIKYDVNYDDHYVYSEWDWGRREEICPHCSHEEEKIDAREGKITAFKIYSRLPDREQEYYKAINWGDAPCGKYGIYRLTGYRSIPDPSEI